MASKYCCRYRKGNGQIKCRLLVMSTVGFTVWKPSELQNSMCSSCWEWKLSLSSSEGEREGWQTFSWPQPIPIAYSDGKRAESSSTAMLMPMLMLILLLLPQHLLPYRITTRSPNLPILINPRTLPLPSISSISPTQSPINPLPRLLPRLIIPLLTRRPHRRDGSRRGRDVGHGTVPAGEGRDVPGGPDARIDGERGGGWWGLRLGLGLGFLGFGSAGKSGEEALVVGFFGLVVLGDGGG